MPPSPQIDPRNKRSSTQQRNSDKKNCTQNEHQSTDEVEQESIGWRRDGKKTEIV